MIDRTYASWVEPTARLLAADRRELIDFASIQRPPYWSLPNPAVADWTNRDVLAHLAGGNDQLLQTVLRAVVEKRRVDPSDFDLDTDAENARRVAERRAWPVERLIAELQRDSDEVQELLSSLTEDEASWRHDGFALELGQFLQLVARERHDHEHLAQLRGSAIRS